MLWKIDAYLAIPHELLHILAYRLVGKQCRYRIGDRFVHPLEPRTLGERLFILLFPLLVTGSVALGLACLWAATYVLAGYPPEPAEYFRIAPVWHQLLLAASVILMLYSGSSMIDLMTAFRLLLQKLRQQPPDYSDDHQGERESPQKAN